MLTWLKKLFHIKPTPPNPQRRGFLRLMAGCATLAAVAPSILLEPAKASANLISSTGAMRAGAPLVGWATLDERVFFRMITDGVDVALLPSIPNAPDGTALYSSTPWKPHPEVIW